MHAAINNCGGRAAHGEGFKEVLDTTVVPVRAPGWPFHGDGPPTLRNHFREPKPICPQLAEELEVAGLLGSGAGEAPVVVRPGAAPSTGNAAPQMDLDGPWDMGKNI